MSTFAVTRERIGEIRPIKNADRIEIATLAGMDFQFVVGKGQYMPGQEVLYLPIDAVLPPSLIAALGLTGKLSGKEQDRIKTVMLRGAYSQGVVAPVSLVPEGMTIPSEITAFLGVTKYDPPPNETSDGILLPRPENQSMYDLESADRYLDIVESLYDQPVFITEKLEGENAWATAFLEGHVAIGMRNNLIVEKPGVENRFHRVMKLHEIDRFAAQTMRLYGIRTTVYAEFIGPGCGVGNYYGLEAPQARIFDIRLGFHFLPPQEMLELVRAFYGDRSPDMLAPILSPTGETLRGWLGGKTVKEASNGKSALSPILRREGIVIKPLVEAKDDRIGRLVLKQRSPDYLAHSNY